MSSTGSVRSDASLRLFCALRLPDDVLDGLVAWGRDAVPEWGGVRRVVRANLHVTLAFLGRRRAGEVPAIAGALREAAAAAEPARFAVSRYRETRSVGMLVLDDEGGRATALADDLHGRLERLGVYERERSGRHGADRDGRLVAHPHHRPLAELPLDLAEGDVESLLAIHVH